MMILLAGGLEVSLFNLNTAQEFIQIGLFRSDRTADEKQTSAVQQ